MALEVDVFHEERQRLVEAQTRPVENLSDESEGRRALIAQRDDVAA
jgi:hypothetical protein